MKQIILILALLLGISSNVSAKRGSIQDEQNKSDLTKLEAAIALYDNREYEAALVEMDKLAKDYPNDLLVNYERD